jgi:DNA-binding response OmpR family regulator
MHLNRHMGESRGLVVVVEDEPAIADVERLYLSQAGYGVHVVRDGASGLAAIKSMRPVAVVLDVGLPGMDGIELCRTLRASGDWTPLIFVTARDDEVDRVLGLELGADDYLTKPFSPRELVARVRALLRRQDGPASTAPIVVAELSLDIGRHTVTNSGVDVTLTSTEFDLLAKLMSAPGQVFSREQLLSSVWGQVDYGSSRTVDVHVAQLRSKLGEPSPIRTVRGVGYSLAES